MTPGQVAGREPFFRRQPKSRDGLRTIEMFMGVDRMGLTIGRGGSNLYFRREELGWFADQITQLMDQLEGERERECEGENT